MNIKIKEYGWINRRFKGLLQKLSGFSFVDVVYTIGFILWWPIAFSLIILCYGFDFNILLPIFFYPMIIAVVFVAMDGIANKMKIHKNFFYKIIENILLFIIVLTVMIIPYIFLSVYIIIKYKKYNIYSAYDQALLMKDEKILFVYKQKTAKDVLNSLK